MQKKTMINTTGQLSFRNLPISGTLLWGGGFFIALLGLLTPHPILTAVSVLFVPTAVHVLWRPREPPVLLFIVLFQWLQVVMRLFQANLAGVPVEEVMLYSTSSPARLAIGLSLVALLVLMLGQRVGAGASHSALAIIGRKDASLNPKRLFFLYLTLAAVGIALVRFRWMFLGLAQGFDAVADLKWVPLFALGVTVFSGRGGRQWLLTAGVIEVVLGFGGYFSAFKTVFFVLILAALTTRVHLSKFQLLGSAVLSFIVLGLALIWTGVKSDYRAFANQGTGSQSVLISWEDRFVEIGRLSTQLRLEDLSPVLEQAMNRLGYVDFFAETLNHVPRATPHTDGAIWGNALLHVLTPRILFPEKAILESDSEQTMKFTGVILASGDRGTSFSLGYVPESYVDFGLLGMWAPIFFVGMLQGKIYRFLVHSAPCSLLGYGFAISALLSSIYFETTVIKYFGRLLFSFMSMGLMSKYLSTHIFRWLNVSSGK